MGCLDVEAEQYSGAAFDPVFGNLFTGLEIHGHDERRPLTSARTTWVIVGRTRIDTYTQTDRQTDIQTDTDI